MSPRPAAAAHPGRSSPPAVTAWVQGILVHLRVRGSDHLAPSVIVGAVQTVPLVLLLVVFLGGAAGLYVSGVDDVSTVAAVFTGGAVFVGVSLVAALVLFHGYLQFAYALVRGGHPSLRSLVPPYAELVAAGLAGSLAGLLTIVGLVLGVVPGLVLAARLAFAPLALADGAPGPVAALRVSWERTRGHTLDLLLFQLLLAGAATVVSMVPLIGMFALNTLLVVGLAVAWDTLRDGRSTGVG